MVYIMTECDSRNGDSVSKIAGEIFKLNSPKINEDGHHKICDFISTTINGDLLQEYLVINAAIKKDKKGALVYVLTDLRLIKIEIDSDAQEIKSSSFPLDTITSVERTLIDGDKAQVVISFQNDSLGLKFSQNDKKITEFFQKVDQSRAKGKANG